MKLVIANKNYSSWSLRPWLVLTHFGIPFEEEQVLLSGEGWKEKFRAVSPTGRVPLDRACQNADISHHALAIAHHIGARIAAFVAAGAVLQPDVQRWLAAIKAVHHMAVRQGRRWDQTSRCHAGTRCINA